jgi:predicted dehydrogenase
MTSPPGEQTRNFDEQAHPVAGRLPGRPVRAAVIGAGAISLEHLPFLRDSDRAELVAICDLSPVSARIAARRFEAPAGYVDVAEMLASSSPEIVHVLTPPHTHGVLVRQCLDAGAHVFCEKPMSPTGTETSELLALAAQRDLHLIENHNYRFNDEILSVRRLIDDGDLGEVSEVEIRMALPIRGEGSRFADENNPNPIHRMPAGVIHDFITHFAYLLDTLSGEPEWGAVSAHWNNHGGGDLFTFDDLDAILVGEARHGSVHGRLRFSCRTSPDLFSVTVRGSDGQVATDLFHPHLEVLSRRPGGPQLTPIVNHLVNGASLVGAGLRNFGQKLLQHGPYHGLSRLLDETYAALQEGRELPVTPFQIQRASDLVDALLSEEARR